jgi:hypothetical protein
MFNLTANARRTGVQDVYRASLIYSRDVASFHTYSAPPTVLDGTSGTMLAPVYFYFDASVSNGALVKFPVTPVGSAGEEMYDFADVSTEVAKQITLLNTYGGARSLANHMHMFVATEETRNNQAFNEMFGQPFAYGQHIGWRIWREPAAGVTSGEYLSFDPGTTNATRTPKLNIVTSRGTLDSPASFNSYYVHSSQRPTDQNALYFDHSTGILHINYFMPVSQTEQDSRTKILLTVHLKKAGFRNSNVNVSSSELLSLLNLDDGP